MSRAYLLFAMLVLTGFMVSQNAQGQDPNIPVDGAPESGPLTQQAFPSPNGLNAVFSADFDNTISLWIVGLDGTNLRQLTYNPGHDEDPSWSPDGKTIVFSSTQNGVTNIWSIAPDGSNRHQLTSNSLNNRQPVWSPDGSKIAFVSDRGGTNDIWMMGPDGSSQVRVTRLTGQENHPSFSPSGLQLVFSETTVGTATLMTVNTDGSNGRSLTTAIALGEDWNPQWTASGIYFSSNRGDTTDQHKIWIVQPNGSGLLEYSNTPAVDFFILPDGRVLFSDEFGTGPGLAQVTVLQPSSGAKQLVTSVGSYFVVGDVNLDSMIDCLDLASVKANFGKKVGQAGFNPRADVNHDGVVDVRDLAFVSQHLAAGTICH